MNPFDSSQSDQSQNAAISIGVSLVLWPAAIGVLVLAASVFRTKVVEVWPLILIIEFFTIGWSTIAGTFIGGLAHRLFDQSSIPPTRAAVAFALLFDFTIFGWVLFAIAR